jgi:hypothetical protein
VRILRNIRRRTQGSGKYEPRDSNRSSSTDTWPLCWTQSIVPVRVTLAASTQSTQVRLRMRFDRVSLKYLRSLTFSTRFATSTATTAPRNENKRQPAQITFSLSQSAKTPTQERGAPFRLQNPKIESSLNGVKTRRRNSRLCAVRCLRDCSEISRPAIKFQIQQPRR